MYVCDKLYSRILYCTRRLHCTQTVTNIAKSMANIIDQSGGDFQQGGYLYRSTSSINGHPNTCECLTGLRNKPQQKQIRQHLAVVLMELSVDDETYSCHSVHK